MTEEVKCDCGNDEFCVSVDEGRGVFVELTCTKCSERQSYSGG